MSDEKKVTGVFRYQQDTKRFHKFNIETDTGIVGTVYFPKNNESMPKILVLEYATKT